MGTATLIMIIGFVMFTFAMFMRMFQGWRALWGREMLADLDDDAKKMQDLARTKGRLLKDIKELEFDHEMGHLSETDYTSLRKKLERKTIRLMKSMDKLQGGSDFDSLIDKGLEERFGLVFDDAPEESDEAVAEVEVKNIPAEKAPSSALCKPCSGCGWEMEVGAAFCSQCGTGLSKGPELCLSCDTELDEDAKFCKNCGTSRGETSSPVDAVSEPITEGRVKAAEVAPAPVEEMG